MSANLIDTADIARILKVSREHVTDRLTKQPDFPKPALDRSRRMRRWNEAEVLAWAGLPQASSAAMSDAVSR